MTTAPLAPVETTPSHASAERFLLLDGLRGIAAFAVILDHVPTGALETFVAARYLAVDFFFMLSGFVLAHAYGKRLEGGWSPLAFIFVRLVRLYPLYLAALAMCLALAIFGASRGWDGPSMQDILLLAPFATLFLPSPPLQHWGQGALYPFNGPCWSLFYELVANLAYACLARLLSVKVLAGFLAVAALGLIAATFRHDEPGVGWQWQAWDLGLARVTFAFFAGVAIYQVRTLVKIPVWPVPVAVLALVAVLSIPSEGVFWRHVVDLVATILVLPLIIALSAGTRVKGVTAIVCAGLGAVSYGVYVLQVPVLTYVHVALAAAGQGDLPASPWSAILISSVTACIAAALIVFYEKRVRRFLLDCSQQAKRFQPAKHGKVRLNHSGDSREV